MALTAVAYVQRRGGKYIGSDQELTSETRQMLEIIESWQAIREIMVLPSADRYGTQGGFLGYKIREDIVELEVRGNRSAQRIHLISTNPDAIVAELINATFRFRRIDLRLVCDS